MRFRGQTTDENQGSRATGDIRREVGQTAFVEHVRDVVLTAAEIERERLAEAQKEHGIERFEQLPKPRPIIELQAAFNYAIDAEEIEARLIRARQYMASSNPHGEADAARGRANIANLEAQQQVLLARQGKKPEQAPQPAGSGFGSEVDRALDTLFQDQPVSLPYKRDAARLGVIADRRIVFEAALHSLDQLVRQLNSEASTALHKRLKKAHEVHLVEVYRASQAFARAIADERVFRSAITNAGYAARPDLTPMPIVAGAGLVLGNEHDWESMISQFRRFLEGRKLV
jgi:hypothetical protein